MKNANFSTESFPEFLTEYFLKYTSVTSQSNSSVLTLPSSKGQKELLDVIKADLESFGVTDLTFQDDAILIVKIHKTADKTPMSFMAHVDTVDIGVSPDVKAHVVDFTGEDFNLSPEVPFKVSEHPDVLKYKNDKIIVTDGTSVLGADDKAGVTVMVGLAKYLMENDFEHGDIYLIFVPDEEIGLKGAYAFDIEQLPKDILSYTIDGGPLGEFGYETFNAADVSINIKGVSIHPGTAKDVLVNPILVAHDIIAKLDRMDTPEHSEGKEGFILVTNISGNPSDSDMRMIVRDFDLKKYEARKEFLKQVVADVQKQHPRAEIAIDISESYANMGNFLNVDSPCITTVEKAMKNIDVTLHIKAFRGGTDGAVFSVKGVPTPNIFTGAHELHSIYEYLPVTPFAKSLELVVEMTKIAE